MAVLCLCWVPYTAWHDVLGAAQPIAGTLFTLVFVASALFLLAGAAVIGNAAPRLSKLAVWLAPLLLAMHARYWVDAIAKGLSGIVDPATVKAAAPVVFAAIAVAGAIALLLYARQSWRELGGGEEPVAADGVGQPA